MSERPGKKKFMGPMVTVTGIGGAILVVGGRALDAIGRHIEGIDDPCPGESIKIPGFNTPSMCPDDQGSFRLDDVYEGKELDFTDNMVAAGEALLLVSLVTLIAKIALRYGGGAQQQPAHA